MNEGPAEAGSGNPDPGCRVPTRLETGRGNRLLE